jgi:hypothetical protein
VVIRTGYSTLKSKPLRNNALSVQWNRSDPVTSIPTTKSTRSCRQVILHGSHLTPINVKTLLDLQGIAPPQLAYTKAGMDLDGKSGYVRISILGKIYAMVFYKPLMGRINQRRKPKLSTYIPAFVMGLIPIVVMSVSLKTKSYRQWKVVPPTKLRQNASKI